METSRSRTLNTMILIMTILLFISCLSGPVTAAAQQPTDDEAFFEENDTSFEVEPVADPLSSFNRGMHWFNDKLYFYVLKPVAKGYKAIIPLDIRTSVANAFANVRFPQRFVNAMLQGKAKGAGEELAIFAINSTVGVLGLTTPAQSEFHLKGADEDLGQTLAVYGVGNGCYLVLPFMGPSTLRDTVGSVGDYFLDPLNYIDDDAVSYSLTGIETINSTSLRLGSYESVTSVALDPYLAVKDGYEQLRAVKISE